MVKAYSDDFRRKVIEAIELDGHRKNVVSELFNISRNTIDLWLKRKAETGDIKPKPHRSSGSNHKITDWDKFRAFVQEHGDKTQEQMAQLWDDEISDRTISRALQKIGFTRKKKTYGYEERDEAARQAFVSQLASIHPESLVYADEAGMDSRDDYAYAWSKKGERFQALKSGRRQGRINMIAAYCDHQVLAPFTIEGAVNRTVFETWIEACLIPVLKPGQWLVIDNATFHKGGRIEELVEQVGCRVVYLPAYSPDLNPIEKCWSWIKSRIRHCLSDFNTLRDAMEHVLKMAS